MSHTNTTTNFGLPQFITTDKPAWLTDVNVAYQAIDTAMKNNQAAASNAQSDASQALLDAASAGSTASSAASAASGSIASITNTFSESSTYVIGDHVMYNNLLYKCIANVNVPGAWTGPTNWVRTTIDAYIGGLTGDNIGYSGGVTVSDKLTSLDAANDENVVLRQTQLTLPSTVTLTPNTISTLLNGVDITSLTHSALDDITTMGNDYDLVGAVFIWANGGNSIQVSMLVDTGNKVTLQVYAFVNQNVTSVRLLTYWRRK